MANTVDKQAGLNIGILYKGISIYPWLWINP